MMVSTIFGALCCLALSLTVQAGTYVHDDSFQPDEVLRVSQAEVAMACRYRNSVVVNGTTPGPQLRIKPDRTTWVRVYNDMDDQNLTMVS
jgi:L-ascorbate oxidase